MHRDGQLVGITPKALATLTVLVSHHGTAVSKEDLLASVWSDTAVGEASLSQNVYTLRKLLAPDFPDQSPIENVPRFGYRFNLPVTEEKAAGSDAREFQAQEAPGTRTAYTSDGRPRPQESVSPPELPISFEQNGSSEASSVALRPETHARQSAFRFTAHTMWIAVGVLGAVIVSVLVFRTYREPEGPARIYSMAQLTANDSNNPVIAAAPSPDGEQIAYADDDGILLRARRGGLAHPVRSPELYMVTRVAWLPDRLHLAVSGQDPKTLVPAVWYLSVTGDVPVLLRTNAANALPSPDGKRLAFEGNGGSEIWVSGLNGEGAHRLLTAEPGKVLSLLLWSKDGAEVYISRHDADHSAVHPGKTPFSGQFLAVDAGSAKITAQQTGVVVDQACLLPGNGLLFAGNSGTSHINVTSLWEATLEPRSGAFRSSPRMVQTLSHAILALNSAQQGHTVDAILSSGEADVYVATLAPDHGELRDVRRLTYDVASSYPHSWTTDSRSVIFESRHTGINQLYKQAIDSRNPTQLISTPYDAAFPIITPDGRWIFFMGGEGAVYRRLLRVSSEGGLPAEISLTRGMGQFRCPLLRGACVLRQVVNDEVVFSRLDPIRGEGRPFYSKVKTADEFNSFAVSPDGTELALLRVTGASSTVQVVRFDAKDRLVSSADVSMKRRVEALQWSADGKGWFAEVPSPNRTSLTANSLYFMDASGNAKLLAQSIGRVFGIPSPDGKRLAMVEATRDSNIWTLQ